MKTLNEYINENLSDKQFDKLKSIFINAYGDDWAYQQYEDIDDLVFSLKKLNIIPVSKRDVNRSKNDYIKYDEAQIEFFCKDISNKSFTICYKENKIDRIY